MLNAACHVYRVACPSNCLNCKWSDVISATVCDLGKCAARTFQDTSQNNYACLSMFPVGVSVFFLVVFLQFSPIHFSQVTGLRYPISF